MLAAGTAALWKAETALYSPALVEHLPGAPLLAGMTLHHLYGQRLHLWLQTGAISIQAQAVCIACASKLLLAKALDPIMDAGPLPLAKAIHSV